MASPRSAFPAPAPSSVFHDRFMQYPPYNLHENAITAPDHPGRHGHRRLDWLLARAVHGSGNSASSRERPRHRPGAPASGRRSRRPLGAHGAFPIPGWPTRCSSVFLPDGRAAGTPYRLLPMYRQAVSRRASGITMLANFVEVHLAKEGHDGLVGINLLTKIQLPTLALLYGAMLAGVDYVLMGAGIPREIPAASTRWRSTSPPRYVSTSWVAGRRDRTDAARSRRARDGTRRSAAVFLPIVSSNSLATPRAQGRRQVDGSSSRGRSRAATTRRRAASSRNERGEPFTARATRWTWPKVRELGLPFWLAGGGVGGATCARRRSRCRRHPGRHALRLLRGIRPGSRAQRSVLAARCAGEVDVSRSRGVAHRLPVQGGRLAGIPPRRDPRADLRPWLPADGVPHSRRNDRISLRQRTGRGLREEGRHAGGDGRSGVPLQRADGQHRHGPGARRHATGAATTHKR